jgi:hypothetical protein
VAGLALGRAAGPRSPHVIAVPPARHILSFDQYAALRHPTPYVVDVAGRGARLLLFGSQHSSDPALPMFDQIEAAFRDLAPAFALHEGTPPHPERDREVAIRRHGEAGLIRHLAVRAGIETASMDIPLPEEARLLQRALAPGEALVFLVVRQLASFNRKTARMDFQAYFAEFFDLIAPGLNLAAIDWPLVEREHLRVLGRSLSPRQVTALETDPTRDDVLTQRIARRSNRLRDEHMLVRLLEALAAHRRVFATVGVSHAVMLEPALRAATG